MAQTPKNPPGLSSQRHVRSNSPRKTRFGNKKRAVKLQDTENSKITGLRPLPYDTADEGLVEKVIKKQRTPRKSVHSKQHQVQGGQVQSFSTPSTTRNKEKPHKPLLPALGARSSTLGKVQTDELPMTPRSMKTKKTVSFSGLAEEGQRPSEPRKTVGYDQMPVDDVQDAIGDARTLPEEIENVLVNPKFDIKLENICAAFDCLKQKIRGHCRDHFAEQIASSDRSFPFFTYCKAHHPQLYSYIRYVADGSQYGWHKLITAKNQRENLVYAIVARALIAYIFDAELFGASSVHEEELLDMCREYLYYDGFVRNKCRAKIVNRILQENNANMKKERDRRESQIEAQRYKPHRNNSASDISSYVAPEAVDYFSPAIDSLTHRLQILLEPLIDRASDNSSVPKAALHKWRLRGLIEFAHKIHVSIRLHGKSGSVFHFEDMTKNQYWDSSKMECVNKAKMDLTAEDGPYPLVKVPCFPAITVYVPSGPTLDQFEDTEFTSRWKQCQEDPDPVKRPKSTVIAYPITLADVVLENTPKIPPRYAGASASSSRTKEVNPSGDQNTNATDEKETPQTAASNRSLDDTVAHEQSLLTDAQLLRLTGIDRRAILHRRRRIQRICKNAQRTGKIAKRTALIGAGVVGFVGFVRLVLRFAGAVDITDGTGKYSYDDFRRCWSRNGGLVGVYGRRLLKKLRISGAGLSRFNRADVNRWARQLSWTYQVPPDRAQQHQQQQQEQE